MNDESNILSNPIWSSLISENAFLGKGTDVVKLFDPEVAPFAGLEADTHENFSALFDLVADERVVVLFSPKPDLDTSPFEPVVTVAGYQMVFQGQLPEADLKRNLVQLSSDDVPAMLELTGLAQPGPFLERTIDFGGYHGIFEQGRLVAMGGQRLRANGYTEISAVCSHPDHNGKGFGRQVMNAVIRDILESGNTAYLHVRADNLRAVALYKHLGFVISREMNFYVIKKTALVREF